MLLKWNGKSSATDRNERHNAECGSFSPRLERCARRLIQCAASQSTPIWYRGGAVVGVVDVRTAGDGNGKVYSYIVETISHIICTLPPTASEGLSAIAV